ncbi:MAG: hypothetical protein BWK73_27170 [Thiothrix lacustris]|uniref:Uncharacterized protein n=1 Tax=Thiothrix lacustris TaxID=525917 RepID=A0A1Y1QKC8_9GAMM|nr:MAG: hypothetical protein BWK73_27170 [Thiothrix lacustris]
MTYQEFYANIDCRFPYHDTAAWQQLIAQPVQDIVEPASLALIQQQLLSDAEVMYIMEQLRAYPQQSSALQVALFACADEQGLVDAKYEEIVSEWQR